MRIRHLAFVALLGVSCVAGVKGCGLAPLPVGPAPYDVPPSQLIVGGVQGHLSPSGVQKIGGTAIRQLAIEGCIAGPLTLGLASASYCDRADCPGGAVGCPIYVYTRSEDRPATPQPPPPFPPDAGGDADGKDGVTLAVLDAGSPAQLEVDAKLDALVAGHVSAGFPLNLDCYFYGWTPHLADDSQQPVLATDVITLGTDTDGVLSPTIAPANVLAFTLQGGGCSGLGSYAAGVLNSYQGEVASLVAQNLQTSLQNGVQGALPKPPGIAATAMVPGLAPYRAEHLDYELYAIAGGYSSSGANRVDFGVVAGVNSDADPSTRTASDSSQPAACAVGATVPDLSAAPWMLPFDPAHGTFELDPADFGAAAEPTIGGSPADYALGFSSPLLWLGAQHLINSGAVCGGVGGANLPALQSGELLVLADAGGALFDDFHRPLVLQLATDHAAATLELSDAGADRVDLSLTGLTLSAHAADAGEAFGSKFDVRLQLVLAPNALDPEHLGLEPMLVGLTVSSVANRVDPGQLTVTSSVLDAFAPRLDALAVRQLAGAFGQLVALPGNGTLATTQVALARASDSQADWEVIAGVLGPPPDAGALVDATATAPLVSAPGLAGERALFDGNDGGAWPHVTFTAGPPDSEVSVRVDHGIWAAWSDAGTLDLSHEAFLIQGPHQIEVRARRPGEWATEGASATLGVVIDTVAPVLTVVLQPPDGGYLPSDPANEATSLSIVAHDFVTLDPDLHYTVGADGGASFGFAADASVTVAQALALTDGGTLPLDVAAIDEAGNVASLELTLPVFHGSANGGGAGGSAGTGGGGGGAQKAGTGCGCTQAPAAAWALLLGLLALRAAKGTRRQPPGRVGR